MIAAERQFAVLRPMDAGRILKIGTPSQLIDDLLAEGFTRKVETKKATLEDVFLDLTGKELRDA